MILRVDEGQEYQVIAAQLGVDKHLVTTWIKRWLGRQDTPIANRLQDLPRSGAPDTISPEQWCQIIALSCESPSDYDLPITDWTHRELAREAMKQGILDTISPSHLGKMLKKKTYSLTELGTG